MGSQRSPACATANHYTSSRNACHSRANCLMMGLICPADIFPLSEGNLTRAELFNSTCGCSSTFAPCFFRLIRQRSGCPRRKLGCSNCQNSDLDLELGIPCWGCRILWNPYISSCRTKALKCWCLNHFSRTSWAKRTCSKT